MASILLSTDNSIIGRGFEGGPGFFPGFQRGFQMPSLICPWYLHVLAMLFSHLATPSCISDGPYFTNSAFRKSSPTLFLIFKLSATFCFSKVIRGKMRHFLFHNEFLVCPVEKQISSVYGIKIELRLSAFQLLFLW